MLRVILNPASGGGAGARTRPEIERALADRGLTATIVETHARGDAVDLARNAALDGVDLVVAAGGDGTIHEIANGLMLARANNDLGPALGVIPIGTGNDFAKLLPFGRDRAAAYDSLTAPGTPFDVGVVEWEGRREYFINGMGTGIDVEVVRNIERMPWMPGTLGYLAGLVRALFTYRPVALNVRVLGLDLQQKVMLIAVGNGPCLGGGFYLFPTAKPDDGQLDLCVVEEVSLVQVARVLPRIMRGTHTEMDVVTMHRASTMEICSERAPLYFHLDGELRHTEKHSVLRIETVPQALRVAGATRSSSAVDAAKAARA